MLQTSKLIRKQFWKYLYMPSKFHWHSFNTLEDTKRDAMCLPPPPLSTTTYILAQAKQHNIISYCQEYLHISAVLKLGKTVR